MTSTSAGWPSILGPVTALTLGGLVPVALAGWLLAKGGNVRDYEVARPAPV